MLNKIKRYENSIESSFSNLPAIKKVLFCLFLSDYKLSIHRDYTYVTIGVFGIAILIIPLFLYDLIVKFSFTYSLISVFSSIFVMALFRVMASYNPIEVRNAEFFSVCRGFVKLIICLRDDDSKELINATEIFPQFDIKRWNNLSNEEFRDMIEEISSIESKISTITHKFSNNIRDEYIHSFIVIRDIKNFLSRTNIDNDLTSNTMSLLKDLDNITTKNKTVTTRKFY